MTAELRLRQWARRNYLPPDERDDSQWHPVVLDEMRRRDRELGLDRSMTENTDTAPVAPRVVLSAGIVPLMPSRHETWRIDQSHDGVPAPRMARPGEQEEASSEVETFIPYYL